MHPGPNGLWLCKTAVTLIENRAWNWHRSLTRGISGSVLYLPLAIRNVFLLESLFIYPAVQRVTSHFASMPIGARVLYNHFLNIDVEIRQPTIPESGGRSVQGP